MGVDRVLRNVTLEKVSSRKGTTRGMGSPLEQRWAKLEGRLDLQLDSLSLLRENRTCWIYAARAAGEAVVVKQYKPQARALCAREARAHRVYTQLCDAVPGLLPSEIRGINEETGSLCLTFIEGELMSEVLRKRGDDTGEQRRCRAALERVGELLAHLRARTSSDRPPAPFLEEYLVHTSRSLERTPVLGALFAGYEASARSLYEELGAAGEPTSLSHGDLVFANLILDGAQVGLIDFANANPESHPLDDVYNLEVTCANLLHLSARFRADLAQALRSRLDLSGSDARTHRFYWEYHKRRWLHLQLGSGWIHRARAVAVLPRLLRSSAAPWAPGVHAVAMA